MDYHPDDHHENSCLSNESHLSEEEAMKFNHGTNPSSFPSTFGVL
jgi:hypothetical protein